MSDLIPVAVIGGYLGAGKTTLINHLLATTSERIAVLVNDLGAINIDADLIIGADGATIELANGCICCSLADGFVSALDKVHDRAIRPDRVVIEGSGVADTAAVAAYAHRPGFRLDATVVLADAERVESSLRDPYVGDTVRAQLTGADIVVLTKTDLVDRSTLAARHQSVRAINDKAPIVEVAQGVVSTQVLFGAGRPNRGIVAATGPRTETAFESTSLTFDTPIDRTALYDALGALPPGVVRTKGTVCFADQPTVRAVVQRVGARLEVTTDGPWPGGPARLVFIALSGSGLGPHPLFAKPVKLLS